MTANDTQLIAALLSAKAAIESALLALTRKDAPAESAPAPEPEPADTSGICKHENRTPLPTFGTVEHWRCDDCGYEFRR